MGMWQDSRAADGHRFLRCGTTAQTGGNGTDQQTDGRGPSGSSQKCSGPELQESKQLENSMERAAERTPVDHEDQQDHVD